VRDLALSPDRKTLVVATYMGVWLYELPTMMPIHLWETERGMSCRLNFSPNGKWLAIGNFDETLKVWDVEQRKSITSIECAKVRLRLSRVAFSNDSQCIATSEPLTGIVHFWHAETGEPIAEFQADPDITVRWQGGIPRPLCFSDDGQLLACPTPADSEGTADFISVWHVETGEQIASLRGHTARVYALDFSPCGKYLAAGDVSGGTLREWDVTAGTQMRAFSYPEKHRRMRLTPTYSQERSLLAAGVHQFTIRVWNVENEDKLNTFEYRGDIQVLRFLTEKSPSGGRLKPALIFASQREIKVWDTENPRAVASISREVHYPHFVAFLPDGQTLVSVDSAGTTRWNVAEKRRQRLIARPNTEIRSIYISSTDRIRALGSIENRLLVWDVDTDETIATFAGHQEFVRTFAFAPTGEPFASGDTEGGLYVWDTQGKQTALVGHTNLIRSLAFDSDGNRLVSGSTDGTTRVWDVGSGEEIATLALAPFDQTLEAERYVGDAEQKQRKLRLQRNRHIRGETVYHPMPMEAVAFSPCASLIIGGMHNELRVWDATTYELLMAILPPHECRQPFALTFSSCGRYFASGSWWYAGERAPIELWEVDTEGNIPTLEKFATLPGHPTDIQDLAFSPDNTLLASASFDGTILLWDLKPYLQNESP
jgi:WD40 repeat protein